MLSYQIYKGTLFDMAEVARTFVLSKLDLRVGTRDNDIEASREYEIPSSAVAEAIVNAIAHRDYASSGSVQVELFSDRLVVRNPGTINPALKREDLFVEHASYPNNSLIADQLYQTKLIEKFGTGLTDLVEDCRKAGLRDPVIDDSRTEFVITIWRPDKKSGPLEKQEEQVANSCNCDKNTFLEALHDLKSKIKGSLVIGGDPDDAITAAIYEAIKLSPGIKRAKLIRIVRKSKATVERCLSSLKAQEKIEYRGSNKTGGYYVVEGN
jgi:predicted HTH transcriptional regulator